MLRLSEADVLPFDFSGMSDALTKYTKEIGVLVQETSETVPQLDIAPLRKANERLTVAANRFAGARTAFEASSASLGPSDLSSLNALLRRAEQELAPEHGLPGRPWYRHQVYAPGYDTGYRVKTLPGIREAVERRDWRQARSETKRAIAAITNYIAKIDGAAEILERATSQQ